MALETWVGYPTCVLRVTVGGQRLLLSGAWFDLWGGRVDIHIRVCMSNSCGLRDVASSPHGSP